MHKVIEAAVAITTLASGAVLAYKERSRIGAIFNMAPKELSTSIAPAEQKQSAERPDIIEPQEQAPVSQPVQDPDMPSGMNMSSTLSEPSEVVNQPKPEQVTQPSPPPSQPTTTGKKKDDPNVDEPDRGEAGQSSYDKIAGGRFEYDGKTFSSKKEMFDYVRDKRKTKKNVESKPTVATQGAMTKATRDTRSKKQKKSEVKVSKAKKQPSPGAQRRQTAEYKAKAKADQKKQQAKHAPGLKFSPGIKKSKAKKK